MSFYAANFIFNGVPSENYNIQILKFEQGTSVEDSSAGGTTEIVSKWIYKKQKPYLFGTTQNQALEFDLTIGSKDGISAIDRSKISSWLLSKSTFLPFQICQDDVEEIIFNVIFTTATYKYIGGLCFGMTLHGVCDAPWGFTTERSLSYSFAIDAIQDFDFDFYNDSDSSAYNYPKIEFTLNSLGSNFQIINYTDNDRTFLFTGLDAYENISIDNDLKVMTSSTGFYRLSCFNKNWFRLLPGINSLHMSGGIESFYMYYKLARMIGG
jgi:phage-related protein